MITDACAYVNVETDHFHLEMIVKIKVIIQVDKCIIQDRLHWLLAVLQRSLHVPRSLHC